MAQASGFSGRWHSTYWFPSNRFVGNEPSEYDMKCYQDGNDIVFESEPNAEGAYMFIRLTIDDDLATGDSVVIKSSGGNGNLLHFDALANGKIATARAHGFSISTPHAARKRRPAPKTSSSARTAATARSSTRWCAASCPSPTCCARNCSVPVARSAWAASALPAGSSRSSLLRQS